MTHPNTGNLPIKQSSTSQEQALAPVNAAAPDRVDEITASLPDLFDQVARAIAHDLNNTFMVISSNCELLMNSIPAEDRLQNYAHRIQNATRKASAITETLSAFSKSNAMQTQSIDLDAALTGQLPILKAIAGNRRTVVCCLGGGPKPVELAPGLLRQVIVASLAAICARGSSDESVNIQTGLLRWDESDTRCGDLPRDRAYAWLSIAKGIEGGRLEFHLESVHETLAPVRNLVRSCGGELTIHVDSLAIMVTVYLPRVDVATSQAGSVDGVESGDSSRLSC